MNRQLSLVIFRQFQGGCDAVARSNQMSEWSDYNTIQYSSPKMHFSTPQMFYYAEYGHSMSKNVGIN